MKILECEGQAVGFLYKAVSKDLILVTAWSSGQLQIDVLADEIRPVWIVGNQPRLSVDSHDRIIGVAIEREMEDPIGFTHRRTKGTKLVKETRSTEFLVLTLEQSTGHNIWLGHSSLLLRLGTVDLALLGKTDSSSTISMFDGGVDSIVLHFLPFTNQKNGIDDDMITPTVQSVLNTCQMESSVSPLCVFVALSGSFGCSWIAGLTSGFRCNVVGMESGDLLLPAHIDEEKNSASLKETVGIGDATFISKELTQWSKGVLVPLTSPNPVTAEYFKLFHENYVECAHKLL